MRWRVQLLTITAVLAAFALAAPLVHAVSFVNDDFDDGNVGTNTAPTGIGSGFNTLVVGNDPGNPTETTAVTESGGRLRLINDVHGARRTVISSKEGVAVPASGATLAQVLFGGVQLTDHVGGVGPMAGPAANTDRIYMGLTNSPTLASFENNPPTGFVIQLGSDSLTAANGNGGFLSGNSQLFYESAANVRTPLATWSFGTLDIRFGDGDGLNLSPVLDFELTLSSTGYELSITGDTVTVSQGSLIGTYAGAGITNELTTAYAYAHSQNEIFDLFIGEAPHILDTSFDRIVISDGNAGGLACDFNSSGACNSTDFNTLRDNIFTAGGFALGDMTGNGFIDLRDFRRFKDDPNRVVGGAGAGALAGQVPEPVGVLSVGFALLLVSAVHGRTRRRLVA